MLSLCVITPFLFDISCCRREEKKANLQNSHCTEYPLAKILSSHFFGKPSYSLYVWRKKFANNVLPSVVCVVVAIFVARGYTETNLQNEVLIPSPLMWGRFLDSNFARHGLWLMRLFACRNFLADPYSRMRLCGIFFCFCSGCQLAKVHISSSLSLLIWGRFLGNYFANHAVCVEHFLFQFVGRGYRD